MNLFERWDIEYRYSSNCAGFVYIKRVEDAQGRRNRGGWGGRGRPTFSAKFEILADVSILKICKTVI